MTSKLSQPVRDPIYDCTKQPIAIDGDTLARTSITYSAQTNGSATLLDPLNATSGSKTTIFVMGANSSQPFRWNTMALRMRMVFHKLADTTAAAQSTSSTDAATGTPQAMPYNSPSWNMVGALINQIKVSINDTEVWSSIPTSFLSDWTARLIRNHTYDSLSTADYMVFTPIFDQKYTASTARAVTAVEPSGTVWHLIKPAVYDCASCMYARYIAHNDAVGQFFGYIDSFNTWGDSPQSVERAKRWCSGNTHQRVITKAIPFCDLFPRFPESLITNMRQLKIEIIWNPVIDTLDHYSTASTADTDGGCSVIGCDIITDTYIPQSQQFDETVKEKLQGETDNLGFLSSQVYHLAYVPGTDLIIPGISNFDSVLIMQPARGFTNGQATTDLRTYNSYGQNLIFGNCTTAAAGLIKLYADAPQADALPITSAQIQFAGRLYPATAIQTSQTSNSGTTFDPTQLYTEYKKACGKLSRREVSAAVPMWAFKGSFPFIYLRPWSDNGFHLSNQSSDLIIRLQGGYTSSIDVVIFRAVLVEVNADGMVQVHK